MLSKFLILQFIVLITCIGCQFVTSEKDFYLKPELKQSGAKYYRDFNIFERLGVDEIEGDTLFFPFFAYFEFSDSTYLLKLFQKEGVQNYIIPKSEQVIYTFHNINDGPRHIYSKIVKDKIVRYCYSMVNPSDFYKIEDDSIPLADLIPDCIEYVSNDTCYSFNENCYLKDGLKTQDEDGDEWIFYVKKNELIKYAIFPFRANFDIDCKYCTVSYFDSTGHLWHYEKDLHPNEEWGINRPRKGIYGYVKRFKYWSDYHNLRRMI